jgi:hypothetical protein
MIRTWYNTAVVRLMVAIRKYVSKFESRIDEDVPTDHRFVAYYPGGTPALMIEFSASDFQMYGPRALRVDEFVENIRSAIQTQPQILRPPMGPGRFSRSNLFSAATILCATNDGETSTWPLDRILGEAPPGRESLGHSEVSFDVIKSMISPTASYVSVTVPQLGLTHWADIDGTPNARSGFAFRSELFRSRYPSNLAEFGPFDLHMPIMALTRLPASPDAFSGLRFGPEDVIEIANFTVAQLKGWHV